MAAVILALDADAYFCQVEQLRNPGLQGKPIAVQQHQDIIAANHAAKQAGVQKHMSPHEARSILSRVGGQVVHVFCEDGFRVSYRPYRETSAALIKLLKRCPEAAVVEKASIDEAYILMHQDGTGNTSIDTLLDRGVALAEKIRTQVKKELGITLSVGVSTNKLLAKLASRPAKPDGVMAVAPGTPAMRDLFTNLPIDKLPGMGGRVAQILSQVNVTTCTSLSTLLTNNPLALQMLGMPPVKAQLLISYLKGEDTSEVLDKGAPKSFRVQMTLTPIPIPAPHVKPGEMPIAQPSNVQSSGSGPQQVVMLQPLPVQGPDSRVRMSRVLGHMCRDLVSRVILDRHEEGRWPKRLRVQLQAQQPGSHPNGAPSGGHHDPTTHQSMQRSAVFPSAGLLDTMGQLNNPQSPAGQQRGQHQAPGCQGSAAVLPSTAGNSTVLVSERAYDPLHTLGCIPYSGDGNRVGTALTSGQQGASIGAASNCTREMEAPRAGMHGVDDVQGADESGNEGLGAQQSGAAAVMQAVHTVADSLARTILQQLPGSWVVVQAALEASGMVSADQASAPTISRFLIPTNTTSSNAMNGGSPDRTTDIAAPSGQPALPPPFGHERQQDDSNHKRLWLQDDVPAGDAHSRPATDTTGVPGLHVTSSRSALPRLILGMGLPPPAPAPTVRSALPSSSVQTRTAGPSSSNNNINNNNNRAVASLANFWRPVGGGKGGKSAVPSKMICLSKVFQELSRPFANMPVGSNIVCVAAHDMSWQEGLSDVVAERLKQDLLTRLQAADHTNQTPSFRLIQSVAPI